MCALDQDSVDGVWTGPSFRRPQHDCRPRTRPLLSAACGTLHLADLLVRLRDRLIQLRKHRVGVVTGDDDRRPPLSTKIGLDVFVAAASVDRRPGDLGTVHVQDRQHRAVASWIQERRELPRAGQRPGLRFAVADHTGHHEVRMIEGSAGRMGKGVAELAAFVDASGCLHTHMAGHSAGSGESPTHPVDALGVVRDFRIDLRVRSLEIRRRDQRRTAVPGTGHVKPVCAGGDDVPIEERVDHRQAGAGPPVPEQSGLDVLGTQRFPQKRVVLQIDLRDGQVVGRCPPLQVERELVFGIVVIGHQRLPYLTRVPEQSARACAQSRA